ncbi:DNA damage-binding protein 2 [Biomphalaria glabrata]|nr:DNA damage-binding protein 2 [Biomphalaria glabrata]
MKGRKKTPKPNEHNDGPKRSLRKRNITAPIEAKSDSTKKVKKSQKKPIANITVSNLNHAEKTNGETEFESTSTHHKMIGSCTRSWPVLDFENHRSEIVNCTPHLWPLHHDCSKNIFHYITNNSLGRPTYGNKMAIDRKTLSAIEDYDVFSAQQPYHSRITAIEWHPKMDNHFCVGSKHGDLGYYRLKYKDSQSMKIKRIKSFTGIGPGGYISAMKFHPTDDNKFFTASLDGKVSLGDMENDTELGQKVFLNTCSWERWYCSLDAHKTDNLVVAGSNAGHTHLLSRTGDVIWDKRLHSQKVSHLEFSPCEPHLLCSASLDHTVRMWDLRMVNEKKPLSCLHHDKGINSAFFSLTDGTRLLTTDQGDNIRIYRAPFWQLETDIRHPHRFFQHITPIKAYWHPLSDTIMCGRFPDEKNYPDLGDKRAIDFFNPCTGVMVYSLKNVHYNNITSLCKFNNTGNVLLSAMGYNMLLWSTSASQEVSEDHCAKDKKQARETLENQMSKEKIQLTCDKSKDKKISKLQLNIKDKRKSKDNDVDKASKKRKRN